MLRRGDHPDEEAKLRSFDLYTPAKVRSWLAVELPSDSCLGLTRVLLP